MYNNQPGSSNALGNHGSHPQRTEPPANNNRPDDCTFSPVEPYQTTWLTSNDVADVYFERSTNDFSNDAVARSTAAKLKLESFYKVAVDSAIERNARCVYVLARL